MPPAPLPVILIVEDDPDVAAIISEVIDGARYRSIIAPTVADAAHRAREHTPSLVLLDWILPDGTGADVVRVIRARHPSVPIVVMSAMLEAPNSAKAVGANERLAKPLELERIVDLVRRYCS